MKYPRAIEVIPSGPVRATFVAPSSKSVTNRALVCAALADGESTIREPLVADDTVAMAEGLRALGAQIETEDGMWLVRGTGGIVRPPQHVLDCGLSGTTLRFLSAVGALSPAPVRLSGAPPLMRRPMGPLVDALRALGACASTGPPVEVWDGLDGGRIDVDASLSSQFASALMLAAPYARADITLNAGGISARGYFALTAAVMEGFGARVERIDDTSWRVQARATYSGRDCTIEYDASTAAHLYALAIATGGSVTVTNAAPTGQPDAHIIQVFKRMAARIGGNTVDGPERPRSLAGSLEATPDQLPTVAVLCALAEGTSQIRGVAVARAHEADRIAAVAAELRKVGARVQEHEDGLTVTGGDMLGARIATYDDHRMAMAFAALGARIPGIVIEEPGCVAKTYPGFWDDLRGVGIGLKDSE